MAINPQKLLPPGKLTPAERMAAAYDRRIDDLLNVKVKTKLINVDKFLNKSKKTKEVARKTKRKNEENKQRQQKEERLEKAKSKGIETFKLPTLPRTGILDSIQNFIGYTFFGYLLLNYGTKIGGLSKTVDTLISALDTTGKIVVGTFDLASGIIDGAYKTKNELSEMAKNVGGENAQKEFDNFTVNFKNMINSIMTLGLYQAPKEPTPKKSNGGVVKKMAPGGLTTRAGKPVGGTIARKVTPVRTTVPARVFRQVSQPGKDIGGIEEIQKIFVNPIDPNSINPLGSLTTTSALLKRIPFVGSLMGAAVDVAMGQKPDRRIYTTFGDSIAYLVTSAIENQTNLAVNDLTNTILSMADGGITRGITKKKTTAQEIGSQIGQLFEGIIQSTVNVALSRIANESQKTPFQVTYPGGGGAGAGAGGYAQGEAYFVSSKQIYSYLKSKGLSHNHIMGMLANIQAESSFNAGAIGDSGTSGGLFQHHAERFSGMVAFAGKNWKQNWKAQVDYALREDSGKQYAGKTFNTPEEASSWFTLNFERPANKEQKARERLGNLKNFGPDGSYTGGGDLLSRMRKSISGLFGARRGDRTHGGLDIAASIGTPLVAPTDGKVIETGNEPGGWGNYLVFKDANGFYHLYGHMPSKGRTGFYKAGDIIGSVGQTGRASGPHLHWEVGTGWNGTITGKFDPQRLGISPFGRPTQKVKGKKVAAEPTPTTAQVASSTPAAATVPQQIAMTPSYAAGGGTTLLLQEKLILKEVPTPLDFPGTISNLPNPSVNSNIPVLIG